MEKYQAIIYEKRISLSKNKIVNNIKDVFNKNKNMASYSVYLSSHMLDEIFNNYLLQYVGKIDIDDKITIRETLEKALNLKLSDLMNEIELNDMYNFSREYIEILIKKPSFNSLI